MSVETQIQEWSRKGLITETQRDQILEYERSKPKANWVLRGFLSLGVLVLGIGLISLIAANWEAIPGSLKLGGDFLILCVAAILTFRYHRKNNRLGTDVTSLFFALLCLASIGLIAQVFHTSGELYEAFLFWNLITLPFLLFSELKLSFLLWTSAFVSSLAWWAADYRIFGGDSSSMPYFYFAAVPFFSAALGDLTGLLPQFRALSFSFRFAYFASTLVFLVVFNLLPHEIGHVVSPNFLFFAVTGGSIALSLFCSSAERLSRRVQVLNLAVLILLAVLVFISANAFLTSFRVAALTIIFCIASALAAGAKKEKRVFNFWTFAAGFRFLILYFEALRGLAVTGIGLIFSGALIIGTALLWNKYRAWMFKKAEEWIA